MENYAVQPFRCRRHRPCAAEVLFSPREAACAAGEVYKRQSIKTEKVMKPEIEEQLKKVLADFAKGYAA